MNTKIEALENQLFKYFGENYKDIVDVNLFDLNTIKLPELEGNSEDLGKAHDIRKSIIDQMESTLFLSAPLLIKDSSLKSLNHDICCCKEIMDIMKNETSAKWYLANKNIDIKKIKLTSACVEEFEKEDIIKLLENIKYN